MRAIGGELLDVVAPVVIDEDVALGIDRRHRWGRVNSPSPGSELAPGMEELAIRAKCWTRRLPDIHDIERAVRREGDRPKRVVVRAGRTKLNSTVTVASPPSPHDSMKVPSGAKISNWECSPLATQIAPSGAIVISVGWANAWFTAVVSQRNVASSPAATGDATSAMALWRLVSGDATMGAASGVAGVALPAGVSHEPEPAGPDPPIAYRCRRSCRRRRRHRSPPGRSRFRPRP